MKVLVSFLLILLLGGCEAPTGITSDECAALCREGIEKVSRSHATDCAAAIDAVRRVYSLQPDRRRSTNGQTCYNVTADDCKHDIDLCPKVGTRVCYKDNRDDCAHDIDLCPGRR